MYYRLRYRLNTDNPWGSKLPAQSAVASLLRFAESCSFCFLSQGKGADGVWFTPDDVISSSKVFLYKPDGSKRQDNKYISAGPDGEWFTDDDEPQYYVIFKFEK
jgi:hypothetical protein